VTDDKDRRLMSNLINTFCGPSVLEEGYSFSPSGTYLVPGSETVAEVRLSLTAAAAMPAHTSHLRLLSHSHCVTHSHATDLSVWALRVLLPVLLCSSVR
jgi:hypothetical protein